MFKRELYRHKPVLPISFKPGIAVFSEPLQEVYIVDNINDYLNQDWRNAKGDLHVNLPPKIRLSLGTFVKDLNLRSWYEIANRTYMLFQSSYLEERFIYNHRSYYLQDFQGNKKTTEDSIGYFNRVREAITKAMY